MTTANSWSGLFSTAHRGYLRWLFRPAKAGLWRTRDELYDMLDAERGRRLPCPVLPRPRQEGV